MLAYFEIQGKLTDLLCNKIKQVQHAVLHPSENTVRLKWLLLNSELQFRVLPCSSTSWELQLKGCLCTNIKPDLSHWRKGKLKAYFICREFHFQMKMLVLKSHPRTVGRGFIGIFFFGRYSFPICHCSFQQLLASTGMHNATWPILLSQCLGP